MKLSIAVGLCTSALACSHESRPRIAPTPAPPPAFISRLEEAPVKESVPAASGIPASPQVAPPVAPVAAPADQTPLTLTPASGVGSTRSVTAQLVPTAPARDDKADSAADQESIRDIRAQLALDPTLGSIAPKLVLSARNGRIWLRGQVTTAAQRAAIEKVARQATGVINVTNELVVLE
jgi:hypothetical protein